AAVDNADAITVIAASHHFLTAPKPSPNGRKIAWLGWNHPAMPWDGTQLCVAEYGGKSTVGNGDDAVENYRVVAGGPRESVCQFEWENDENILALTDPEGWWNLHRIQLNSDSADSVSTTNLAPCAEEIGGPLWRAGTSWFAPLGANQPGRFIVLRSGNLAVLDEKSGTVTDVKTEFTSWFSVYSDNGVVAALANNATSPTTVVTVEIDDTNKCTTVRALTTPHTLPAEYLPRPESRTFTDKDGNKIPAYVYPPKNPEFTGEDGELPPYLIHVHGGPTGREFGDFDAGFAYFTSRGIGVVAVNYGGSVGYGRQFRERLLGQWGVVDVDDCAAVASALADEGTADRRRLAIRGGSAGGWTSAASLTSVDVYACGTVLYPILDLRGWTADGGETHDFESRYIEGLVGELPTYARRYHDRSPINNVDKLAGPVLLLQGLDDQICPPVQAERFIKALAGKGIAHAYLAFDGEQHGFRKAETIRAAFEAELSFYGQVFGFEPPGVPKLPLNT
ncbi:MAG: S9 family peptidase, partial [Sciscionella sp.]|nr:S9 family peptidase [Sciscionella sp.]